jgi:hypothetical protein
MTPLIRAAVPDAPPAAATRRRKALDVMSRARVRCTGPVDPVVSRVRHSGHD